MTPHLVELRADETFALRRTVLRDGTPSDRVDWDGDRDDTTFHLGVELDGQIVAISSWLQREYEGRPVVPAYQLRGMASAPDHRGHGSGAVLLHAGTDVARARGAQLIWARSRDSAVAFYEHHGFVTVGSGFTDPTTAIPHHHVVLDLA